jgi:uncharacterized protein
MTSQTDTLLERIVDTIVAEVSPEKVVLFGSRARGDALEDSDYDFLVIVRGEVDERACSRTIHRALFAARIPAAVDIVVVNARELPRRRKRIYDVSRWALDEGRVVHGA